MSSLLFYFGLPFFAAYAIIYLLRPEKKMKKACYVLMASMALPLGLGISSCIYFIQINILKGFPRLAVLETLVWIAIIGLVAAMRCNPGASSEINKMHGNPGQKICMPLSVGFILVAIAAIGIFVVESMHQPHGNWDAISIWNLRARFLFRGDVNWAETFTNHSSLFPADYPLLIPCAIARLWDLTVSESALYPVLIAFSFMAASVVLLVLSLAIFTDLNKGLLAGMVLLGIPYFTTHSAAQCADVPLGFYMLSTFVLLLFSQRAPQNKAAMVFMAGTMAGLSSWTKNEGLLFLAAVVASLLLVKNPEEKRLKRWEETTLFICGAVPVLAVVAYFKFKLAPESIYVSGLSPERVIEMMSGVDRHLMAAEYFAKEVFSLMGPIIILFPFCLFFLGVSLVETSVHEIKRMLFVFVIVFSGYYIVFIIAPYELEFNLAFSLKRLYLHLLPSVVLVTFLMLPPLRFSQIRG